jgi:uncharacterized repeat protein (TIGR01451 family)
MHQGLDVRRSRLAAVLLGAALLTLGGSPGLTAHAETPPPQLSIAVDNGGTAARSGDKLSYTLTVTNLGTRKVENLRVSQTIPSGAAFVSADAEGRPDAGKVGWSVDLPTGKEVRMHTTMTVGSTSESALRLATVACAQVSAKGPALVCASDSDQLPAGAAAEQAETDAASSSAWLDGRTPWYLGGGAAVLLAALGAALLVRRHRGAVPSSRRQQDA